MIEEHRRFLVGLAYRMLGSLAEAEDIVQDAYLRTRDVSMDEPRAYLARVVTNLCLDRLKSARARREEYVGTWLPEPVVEDPAAPLAEDLSVALLMVLERLSPLERAAFLLHDIFDMDYADVAKTLERSEAACRQLASRAREHVREARPQVAPPDEHADQIVAAFVTAAATGDVAGLASMLAEDAVLYTDGGGKRRAALNPIYGRDKIARFFDGVRTKNVPTQITPARINGLPGYVFHVNGEPETIAFEIHDGAITRIYGVRNPDKLHHLGDGFDLRDLRSRSHDDH
ncbi:MAG TPA: sigma-70 family RNA polymerase sigma factor [Kofleriaceae bacterium]|nr:sigma-70 family RNA polymerase sigma factor [Kofleriaceae bacterium]